MLIDINKTVKIIKDSNFKWDDFSLDVVESWIAEVAEIETMKQKLLGRIALELYHRGGLKEVKNVAKQAGIPWTTLKGYADVVARLKEIYIPEDLTWSQLKLIAWSPNPKQMMEKVLNEEMTYIEMRKFLGHLIKEQ